MTSAHEILAELGWGYRPSLRKRPSPSPIWPQFFLLGKEDTGSLRGVCCVHAVVLDGRGKVMRATHPRPAAGFPANVASWSPCLMVPFWPAISPPL